MQELRQIKKIHRNIPQLRSALVDAPYEYLIAGRATGKSEGVLADKSARRATEMPRATFGLVAATYQQLLTRTLPPLIKGWEDNGYINGVHFLIGQKPTEKWKKLWKYPGAYRPVQKFEHTISWYNGFSMQMISQDRFGTSNGMSLDGVMGDEMKLLNRDRLHQETLPANRGLVHAFAANPHHHGLTFTTDMPVGTSGRWILEKEKDSDVTRAKQIIELQVLRQQCATPSQRDKIDAALRLLRKGLVYFHEASTLDNLHALGIDYIRDMMRDVSEYEFVTSILNRRPTKLEDGFYPDLDEEKHGYFAYDYHKFENIGYDFNKLKDLDGAAVDSDYDPLKSLHIALDYNRAITAMVVGQVYGAGQREIRCINGIHSEYPKKLDDTLQSFLDYYKHHLKKVVYFWFDHTATAEYSHAGAQCDDVVKKLRSAGWTVIERYIGQAHGHERRYTMYGHLLKNENSRYPYVLRINRDRCKYLLLSMYQAQAVRTKKGFGKDKKPELDPKFPAAEATHYSEALDMLICGILESGLSFADEGVGESSFLFA